LASSAPQTSKEETPRAGKVNGGRKARGGSTSPCPGLSNLAMHFPPQQEHADSEKNLASCEKEILKVAGD